MIRKAKGSGPVIMENENLVSVHMDSMLDFLNTRPENPGNRRAFDRCTSNSPRGENWYGETNKSGKDAIGHAITGDRLLSLIHI